MREYVVVQVTRQRWIVAERNGDGYKAITGKFSSRSEAGKVCSEITELDVSGYSQITKDKLLEPDEL